MTEGVKQFETGAVRSNDRDGDRYDLISPIGLRRVAETCAEGAAKYGDYNWERGMPISEMLNHGIAHIYNYLAGDRSEDHLAHAAWNLLGAMHSEEMWPQLNETLRVEGCRPPGAAFEASTAAAQVREACPAGDEDVAIINVSMTDVSDAMEREDQRGHLLHHGWTHAADIEQDTGWQPNNLRLYWPSEIWERHRTKSFWSLREAVELQRGLLAAPQNKAEPAAQPYPLLKAIYPGYREWPVEKILKAFNSDLQDLGTICTNISRVYSKVTNGKVSSPMTDPAIVCAMADEAFAENLGKLRSRVRAAIDHLECCRDGDAIKELEKIVGPYATGTPIQQGRNGHA